MLGARINLINSLFMTVSNLIFAVPFVYLGLFLISRVSDIIIKKTDVYAHEYKRHYKRTVAVMIVFTAIISIYAQHIGVHKQLSQRPTGKTEIYTLKNIIYNIRIQDDGSADVEHVLNLRKNLKNTTSTQNNISYEFDETDFVSDIQVFLNGNEIARDSLGQNSTYTYFGGKNNNKIDISVPYLKESMDISIKYRVKNALQRDKNGNLTYYNKFLAHRGSLAYNTNFTGKVRFFVPSDMICNCTAYSRDMYVEANKQTSGESGIDFENRISYYQFLPIVPGLNRYYLQGYDSVNINGENNNDFILIARADFVTQGTLNTKELPYIQDDISTLTQLDNMSENNNAKYSFSKYIVNYTVFVLGAGILIMLAIAYPFLHFYGKAREYEYSQMLYDEEDEID